MENWRPVVSLEGLYEVSDLGRIRIVRQQHRRWKPGYVLKPGRIKGGYLLVSMHKDRVRRCALVSRVVAEAFHGPPPPERPQANHRDGDKTNNRPSNLEWVNQSGNIRHAIVLGLKPPTFGSRTGTAKLNEVQVERVRSMLGKGVRHRIIAACFGVSRSTITWINCGGTWRRA